MVRMITGGQTLMALGYDSVGSVICERSENNGERFYLASVVLLRWS
jgi:hypothetical protein